MNILFLSHLSGASYAGPTYSVPKQIEAQSKIDNVFWYNATFNSKEEWKSIPYYHDLSEYPDESIYKLSEPFNHPDIIVVELFYNMAKSNLRKELVSGNIPYVIIPRGELTKQAQKRKKLKKIIANTFICRQYAKKAAAIQYLTEQEYTDSGDSWNSKHIVIPNGIEIPEKVKEDFCQDGIKCISIGRIEPYQKGLDLLIEACAQIKDELEVARCKITICGPDTEGKLNGLKQQVHNYSLDSIVTFKDGVYGQEKEDILLSNDVFIISSRFEGQPMALIEALSFGLPCIVTTGSNMRKEVEEYDAGWTADNSIKSIAVAISDLLREKSLFNHKGKQARELSGHYAWDIVSMNNHVLYTELQAELQL